jgi:hypothetical protein
MQNRADGRNHPPCFVLFGGGEKQKPAWTLDKKHKKKGRQRLQAIKTLKISAV